jgi:DNA-binding response OmpR family regulator
LLPQRSVLVVDRSEETREVLRTALERRGVRILSASRAQRGLEMARQHRPDLIVLDLEWDNSAPEEICAPFARESQARQTPLVMLGSLRHSGGELPAGEFVPKPYHYGPLIHRIEELLSPTGQVFARGA